MRCFPRGWTVTALEVERRNPSSTVLVAEQGGRAIGYAVLRTVVDEAELHEIAVEPTERSKGAATLLLERALEVVGQRGARLVHLEVRASNRPARRLYERVGFATVNVRRGYYPDGEDAYLMTWER